MTREEALDKLCHSYSGYFDVVRHEEPEGYLVAEAGLHIHSEKYVLVKAAKLWEADNNEYVYIFSVPVLTKEIFEQCREQARADGMQRIEPGPNHMCSYITAIFCVIPVSRMRCVLCAARVFIRASSWRSTAGWITTPASWSSAPAKRLPMAADAVQHSC